jgi:hypothetical protein
MMIVLPVLFLFTVGLSYAEWESNWEGSNEDYNKCFEYVIAHPFSYEKMVWTPAWTERKLEYEKNLLVKFPKVMIPHHYLGWTYYNIGLDNYDNPKIRNKYFKISEQMFKKALKFAHTPSYGCFVKMGLEWTTYKFDENYLYTWKISSRCNEFHVKYMPFYYPSTLNSIRGIRIRLNYELNLMKRFPESYLPYYHLHHTYEVLSNKKFSSTKKIERFYLAKSRRMLERALPICLFKQDKEFIARDLKVITKWLNDESQWK